MVLRRATEGSQVLMARSLGRTGGRWRAVARQVRQEEATCWVCGQVIDPSIRWPDPMSFSVDHVVPLQFGGDELSRANLRAAHLGHNVARSNRLRGKANRAKRLQQSQEW